MSNNATSINSIKLKIEPLINQNSNVRRCKKIEISGIQNPPNSLTDFTETKSTERECKFCF